MLSKIVIKIILPIIYELQDHLKYIRKNFKLYHWDKKLSFKASKNKEEFLQGSMMPTMNCSHLSILSTIYVNELYVTASFMNVDYQDSGVLKPTMRKVTSKPLRHLRQNEN